MQEKHFVYFTFLDPVVQEYYAQKYHFHKLAKGNEFLPASHMSRSQAKKKKKTFHFHDMHSWPTTKRCLSIADNFVLGKM